MKPNLLELARQADEFFMGESPIHDTMRRLTATLRDMNIPFAIADAMAANAHGHRRTTVDVDVLMRREDLIRFKNTWLGRGWIEKFAGSKGFKDVQNNVNVDILLTGDYPGDGLPKPVSFPAPELVVEFSDGLPYVSLRSLIEMKLASGMSAKHRPCDLDDVIQLIRCNKLKLDYVEHLDPYVHEKFKEMWHAAQVEEDY